MKKNARFLIFLCICMHISCSAFSKENIPYAIKAQVEMSDESDAYDIAGLNVFFLNKEKKTVKEFTLVFYLFDEDGEPTSFAKNNISLCVQSLILPEESAEFTLSLDSYVYVIPEDVFSVDYIYISKIVYEDDSEWTDPYGMKVFY